MAWLAVDKDGTEIISNYILKRNIDIANLNFIERICSINEEREYKNGIQKWIPFISATEYHEIAGNGGIKMDKPIAIPNGTIKKLIGRSLTWEDEPVELK